jgi:hypothetical protein
LHDILHGNATTQGLLLTMAELEQLRLAIASFAKAAGKLLIMGRRLRTKPPLIFTFAGVIDGNEPTPGALHGLQFAKLEIIISCSFPCNCVEDNGRVFAGSWIDASG